ncbi:MAG: hypothetical protein H7837_11235 [Magnetococcus sp. MYC-9]
MNDLFAAQGLLIDRLSSQLPALRLVKGVRELATLHERPGTTPAAYVLYDGQDMRMGAGQAQVVDQRWLVVLVVRSRRELAPVPAEGGERQEAGPLLIQLCRALLGWKPDAEHGPLALAQGPNPTFRDGFGFYTLRFVTRLTIRPA